MFKQILRSIGLAGSGTKPEMPPYHPYTEAAANRLYNLLFCDDASAFLPGPGQASASWQAALASDPADVAGFQALASDVTQDGRVRFLAFQRLRSAGTPVPPKVLVGVVVEVPLHGGLDTLAAYSDGGLRYINRSGGVAIVEGVSSYEPYVSRLFAASQPVVDKIGPWLSARRRPPVTGNVRLTFLVSDGLYFGEGPFNVMQIEPLAGPVISETTALLQALVSAQSK
jgi:hypothetical protein